MVSLIVLFQAEQSLVAAQVKKPVRKGWSALRPSSSPHYSVCGTSKLIKYFSVGYVEVGSIARVTFDFESANNTRNHTCSPYCAKSENLCVHPQSVRERRLVKYWNFCPTISSSFTKTLSLDTFEVQSSLVKLNFPVMGWMKVHHSDQKLRLRVRPLAQGSSLFSLCCKRPSLHLSVFSSSAPTVALKSISISPPPPPLLIGLQLPRQDADMRIKRNFWSEQRRALEVFEFSDQAITEQHRPAIQMEANLNCGDGL